MVFGIEKLWSVELGSVAFEGVMSDCGDSGVDFLC